MVVSTCFIEVLIEADVMLLAYCLEHIQLDQAII